MSHDRHVVIYVQNVLSRNENGFVLFLFIKVLIDFSLTEYDWEWKTFLEFVFANS